MESARRQESTRLDRVDELVDGSRHRTTQTFPGSNVLRFDPVDDQFVRDALEYLGELHRLVDLALERHARRRRNTKR